MCIGVIEYVKQYKPDKAQSMYIRFNMYNKSDNVNIITPLYIWVLLTQRILDNMAPNLQRTILSVISSMKLI